MARIRTIKPEFCESESIGKLSREARLLFILLWTIVDDSGKTRASSRLLASRLYPYDTDVPALIGAWLQELDRGGQIRLYEHEGDSYLDIPKWLKHQRIDHPSPSRLPNFSRGLARAREDFATHTLDLGPRTVGPLGVTSAKTPTTRPPRKTKSQADDGGLTASAVADAVTVYNEIAASDRVDWPACRTLTPKRERALAKLLNDPATGGVSGWRAMLDRASESDWLAGRQQRRNGHENWRADIGYLARVDVFAEVTEGKHDNGNRQGAGHSAGKSQGTSRVGKALAGIDKALSR